MNKITSAELEFTYTATPSQIWKALTDKAEMKNGISMWMILTRNPVLNSDSGAEQK